MYQQQIINAAKLAIRSTGLAQPLRKLIRNEPLQTALDMGRASGWDNAADWLISDDGKSILSDPHIHNFLRYNKNLDIDTELLLVSLRKKLLSIDDQQLADPVVIETVCTLAYQANINEYVWYVSDHESDLLRQLQSPADVSGDIQSVLWNNIARLVMYYRPTDIFSSFENIQEYLGAPGALFQCLREFIEHYASDYEEYMSIKSSIQQFGHISNSTSKQIASNYEEHPYPRWNSLEKTRHDSRKNKLLSLFSEEDLSFMTKPFKVLVAGCGTGYGACEYALTYNKNAQITAIDLSSASLAYATKMARKYGIKNVNFLQMDLLDLPELDTEFDIVECTGVLHHMKDPIEGGKALVSNLRKDGIAHISLYSELARKQILQFRERYKLRPDMSDDEVREYRYRILIENEDAIDNKLSLRADFFDLSRCRDLLFHPLEHRFTVPKIHHMINELGLDFMGFERPEIIRSRYWTNYPSKKDWRNLDRWDEFEHKHPEAFGSLYQIWAKKL